LFAGSQSVFVEDRIIWYQSLALKSGLPFVSCYHSIFFRFCSLFLILCFCVVHQVEKKKKRVILKHQVKKKKKKKKRKKKRKSDTEAPS
jgi:hypothetical protein